MSKLVVVGSFIVTVLAFAAGCSGTTSNGDLTEGGQGQGGGLGGLGGALGGGSGGGTKSDAGAPKGTGGLGGTGGTGTPTSSQCKLDGTTCDNCLEKSCCTEVAACQSNATCGSLVQCANQCNGDRTCVQECVQQYPNGVPPLQTINTCLQSKCAAECQ